MSYSGITDPRMRVSPLSSLGGWGHPYVPAQVQGGYYATALPAAPSAPTHPVPAYLQHGPPQNLYNNAMYPDDDFPDDYDYNSDFDYDYDYRHGGRHRGHHAPRGRSGGHHGPRPPRHGRGPWG